MNGGVWFAAALLSLIAVVLPGAAAERTSCDGRAVAVSDPGNDSSASLGGDRSGPGTDLTGATIQFLPSGGLSIEWRLEEPVETLVHLRSSLRLFAFGYWEDFWSRTVPYAYLDIVPVDDGPPSYRMGLGEHYGMVHTALTARRWTDIFESPTIPIVQENSITIVIPESRLYHHTFAGLIHQSGVVTDLQDDESETFFAGRPTAPVFAVATRSLDPPQDAIGHVWNLDDVAPDGRAVGTPATGYDISFNADEQAATLCRPSASAASRPALRCEIRRSGIAGPLWLMSRIGSVGPDTAVVLDVSAVAEPSSFPVTGIITPIGGIRAFAAQPYGTEQKLSVQTGGESIRVGDSTEGTSARNVWISDAFEGESFSSPGAAWVFAIFPRGTTEASIHIKASGPGVQCGSTTIGHAVVSVLPENFAGTAAVQIQDMWQGAGVTGAVGGAFEYTAKSGMLAFFGGDAWHASVAKIWSRGPGGTEQHSFANSVSTVSRRTSNLFLAEAGPAGRYTFGVDYAAWARGLDAPRLIVADVRYS